MDFKNIVIGALLIGLFVVALLTGFSQLAIENDKTDVITDNEVLNRTLQSINTSIKGIDVTANQTKAAFEEDRSSIETGFLLLGSIFSSGKAYLSVVINVFKGIFSLFTEVLGVNSIIIVVFTGILLIIMVLAFWSLIKRGT